MDGVKIMKYYKKDNEVFAFEADGSQDEYITQDMVRMTSSEVDKHLNPKKYMTDEQLYEIYVKSLRPLTRRQFRLALLDVELLDDLEAAISNIEDTAEKRRIEIEYTESDKFARTSEIVKTMFALINQTEEQINELWEKALTL